MLLPHEERDSLTRSPQPVCTLFVYYMLEDVMKFRAFNHETIHLIVKFSKSRVCVLTHWGVVTPYDVSIFFNNGAGLMTPNTTKSNADNAQFGTRHKLQWNIKCNLKISLTKCIGIYGITGILFRPKRFQSLCCWEACQISEQLMTIWSKA